MTLPRILRVWIPCGGLALVAVGALLTSATARAPIRVFALNTPNQFTIAELRPSAYLCEEPISSPSAYQNVDVWGGADGEPAHLVVRVVSVQGRLPITTGELVLQPVIGEWRIHLGRAVSSGQPARICLVGTRGRFVVSGAPATYPGVAMGGHLIGPQPDTIAGKQFSLVLLSPSQPSLLGALGTAFSRATLWRPSWVGSWTFWLLAAGLLGAFAVAVVAVGAAANDDEEDPPGRDEDGGDGPPLAGVSIEPTPTPATARGSAP